MGDIPQPTDADRAIDIARCYEYLQGNPEMYPPDQIPSMSGVIRLLNAAMDANVKLCTVLESRLAQGLSLGTVQEYTERAVAAERERCATVADRYVDAGMTNAALPAAIRKGD